LLVFHEQEGLHYHARLCSWLTGDCYITSV